MNFDHLYYPENISDMLFKNVDEKMIDHIRNANARYNNSVAVRYFGVQITYSELFKNIEEHAKALRYKGLKKGDIITICLPNSPEIIYYFYACNEIGVTPYLIDPRYTFQKIKTCIYDSNSKLFICNLSTYFDKIATFEHELAVDEIIVVPLMNTLKNAKRLNFKQSVVKLIFDAKEAVCKRKRKIITKSIYQKDFIKLRQDYTGEYKEEYDPNIPAIIVNTSGTSGTSIKGAVHTNRSYNILMNKIKCIAMKKNTTQLERGDSCYGYIPFFSMYGSSTCMHGSLAHGVILDLVPVFNSKKSVKELLNKKSNIVISVPAVFDKIIRFCTNKKSICHL